MSSEVEPDQTSDTQMKTDSTSDTQLKTDSTQETKTGAKTTKQMEAKTSKQTGSTKSEYIQEKQMDEANQTQDSKGKDDEPPPPPFAGLKLKPKRPVQRKPIEEPKKDTPFKVELKHHEFEKPPQTEEVEMECSILLGNAIVDKKVKLAKKEKYKKKVPKKAEDLSSEIETTDEVIDEVVESIETDETPQKPSTPTPTTTETNQSVKLPVKTKGKQELLSASKEESESPFGGIKLKKAQTGKRELDEEDVEKITLKHHEFEQVPLEEEPEKETGVILSNPIMDDKKPKTKRPKVPKLKTDSEPKNEQVLIKKSSMITTLFGLHHAILK
jgi:hypothetical protein